MSLISEMISFFHVSKRANLGPLSNNSWLFSLIKVCEGRKSESLDELLKIVTELRSKEELKEIRQSQVI